MIGWDGIGADSPEFDDRIAQAMATLEANERAMATYDGPSIEASIRFRLLRAFERAFHEQGACSKYGYVWARP